ncbi:4Fe-4S binding protein [Chloroflexota bacterium]
MSDAYSVLADRLGYPNSEYLKRILEHLMTPEQADLCVELPSTLEELSEKLGMAQEEVTRNVDKLFRKGLVIPKNWETMENPRFVRSVNILHDSTLASLRLDPARHPAIGKLWQEFCEAEWDNDRVKEWTSCDVPMFRIIPSYKAILDSPEILPHEDVREIVRAASHNAVVSCTCKKRKASVGKACTKSHEAVCLQLGRAAEYAVSRGTGVKLTPDDTMDLLDEIEEYGLIHLWINSDTMSLGVMCNCCVDCCLILNTTLKHKVPPTKVYAKSRYEARVDQDICDGDKICLRRCPFGAIKMREVAGESKASVDPDKCMGCGVCVVTCPTGAMKFDLVRPKEHIPPAPQRV